MAFDPQLAALVEELFAGAGSITIRRMFGGGGISCDGLMFGLIIDGFVYLKTDERTVAAYEAEGSAPFIYQGRNKPITVAYWRLPDRLFDEPDEAVRWAREAIGVARSAAVKKAVMACAKTGIAKTGTARTAKTGAKKPSRRS